MNTSDPRGSRIPHRAELISLICAVLLVLLVAILSYHSWTAFGARSEELSITQKVVDGTDDLLSYLKDAETGQRGFLLTGADRYLDPYRKALVEIPVTLKALVDVTQPSRPDQARQIEGLKPLIKDKLDELQQTIELRRNKGLDAALAVVLSDRGKAIMDQIRARILEIQTVAYGHLKQYSEEANASAHQLGLISTLGSGALFILLVLSTVTIQRGTRRRQLLIQNLQESEAETREARDLLQTTIGSIGDAVIATDAVGRVTFLNAVAQSLTGWTEEQAAGQPLEQVFVITNIETAAPTESPVAQALREGRVVGLANHTSLTAKDGRHIPIDDSAAPIRDAQGKVIGVVLVFRDTSERMEIERRLAAERAALAATNQELQHFAYAASHDLREPLRTIKAYTQLLQLQNASQFDDLAKKHLEVIVAGATRMDQLIDALLSYSRAGEVTHKPVAEVDTGEVLRAVLANLHGAVEESEAVVTHDPLPSPLGDELHFVQLFQNLIGNALKYRGADRPRIHVSATRQGQEWLFSISDNGEGIAPQYHLQIFGIFKRLHGQDYPGTGIGLATCKKIVERYGGRIWVESEDEKGSTFFFTLPAEGPD